MIQRRILLIDLNRFFGGGQLYLAQLAELLAERAQVFAICTSATLAVQLRSRRVSRVYYAPSLPGGRFVHLIFSAFMCIYLSKRHLVDTIWVNGTPESALLPIVRLLGCTPVVTRHIRLQSEKLGCVHALKTGIAEFIFRICVPFAYKVICVSKPVADDISWMVDCKRLSVIDNWVPSQQSNIKVYNPMLLPQRLLYVGRLQKHKGVSLILDAMHRFGLERPDIPLRLTVVGDGRYRAALEAQAVGLDVVFTGFQDNVAQYYDGADLLINPSLGPEGLPLVSLEGMSFGLCCIFSSISIHKEISDDGRAALLFENGNVADLFARINALTFNPQLMASFGRAARERIADHYSEECARKKYFQVLFDY